MQDVGQVLGQLAPVGVELPLDLLAAADLPEAAADHARPPLGVGLDGQRLAEPDGAAVGRDHAVFHLAGPALAEAAGPMGLGHRAVLGVDDLGPEPRLVQPARRRDSPGAARPGG